MEVAVQGALKTQVTGVFLNIRLSVFLCGGMTDVLAGVVCSGAYTTVDVQYCHAKPFCVVWFFFF